MVFPGRAGLLSPIAGRRPSELAVVVVVGQLEVEAQDPVLAPDPRVGEGQEAVVPGEEVDLELRPPEGEVEEAEVDVGVAASLVVQSLL